MVTKALRDNLNNNKQVALFVALEEAELCVTVRLLSNTHVQTLVSMQKLGEVSQFGDWVPVTSSKIMIKLSEDLNTNGTLMKMIFDPRWAAIFDLNIPNTGIFKYILPSKPS